MIGRIIGLIWLFMIFSIGFTSGVVYWNYRQWKQHKPSGDFTGYVSHRFHLSKKQQEVLGNALAAKDKKIEKFKNFLKEL